MNSSRLFRTFIFVFSLLGIGSFAYSNSYTLSLATSTGGVQTTSAEYSSYIRIDANESIIVEVVNWRSQDSYIGTIALEVNATGTWVPIVTNNNIIV